MNREYRPFAGLGGGGDYIKEHIYPMRVPGFVATDADLVIRNYTNSDPIGQLMLVEVKSGSSAIDIGQHNNYAVLDMLCRAGNEALFGSRQVYKGWYCIWSRYQSWQEKANTIEKMQINNKPIEYANLDKFLTGKYNDVQPAILEFGKPYQPHA